MSTTTANTRAVVQKNIERLRRTGGAEARLVLELLLILEANPDEWLTTDLLASSLDKLVRLASKTRDSIRNQTQAPLDVEAIKEKYKPRLLKLFSSLRPSDATEIEKSLGSEENFWAFYIRRRGFYIAAHLFLVEKIAQQGDSIGLALVLRLSERRTGQLVGIFIPSHSTTELWHYTEEDFEERVQELERLTVEHIEHYIEDFIRRQKA